MTRLVAPLPLLATGQLSSGAWVTACAIAPSHAPLAFRLLGAGIGLLCLVTAVTLLWLAGRFDEGARA